MHKDGHFISAFDINNNFYVVDDLVITSEERCQEISQRAEARNLIISSALFYLIN